MGLLLSCFSLLVFQGVGFLCFKLPVLLDYCVKANKQAAPQTVQCSLILFAYVGYFICAVWPSTDMFFRPKFLSYLCIPKPGYASGFCRPNCSFSSRLAPFSFKTIKKEKKIVNKLLHMGNFSFPMILHLY